MGDGSVIGVTLGVKKFMVWFYDIPDLRILTEPVNGPEHNFQVAQLLRLLKRKAPELMEDEIGTETEDREVCRREWLAEIRNIETSLGEQLREQLEDSLGEYL